MTDNHHKITVLTIDPQGSVDTSADGLPVDQSDSGATPEEWTPDDVYAVLAVAARLGTELDEFVARTGTTVVDGDLPRSLLEQVHPVLMAAATLGTVVESMGAGSDAVWDEVSRRG